MRKFARATLQDYSKFPLILIGLVLPATIFWFVKYEYQLGAFLAYVNCLVIVSLCYNCIKRSWWQGFVISVSLLSMVFFYAISPLYIVFFNPESYHNYAFTQIYYLSHFLKFQICFFVFIAIYSLIFLEISNTIAYKHKHRPLRYSKEKKCLVKFSMLIFFLVVIFHLISKVLHMPALIDYIANVLFLFFNSLLFIYGVCITAFSRKMLFFVTLSLSGFVIFYILGSARGYALFIIVPFIVGILLASDLNPLKKKILFYVFIFGIPGFVFSSNIVRQYGGFSPGFEKLSERAVSVTQMDRYLRDSKIFTGGMLRFFPLGSHAVVSMTPSIVPYTKFSLSKYTEDFIVSLLPIRLFFKRHYTGKYTLRKYGFFITESTSTGVGLIGHFWMIGGFAGIVIGAIVFGGMHGYLALLLNRLWFTNQSKCLFCMAAVFPSLIWTPMHDFLQLVHSIIWQIIAGFILYGVYKHWIGIGCSKKAGIKKRILH